MLPAADRFLRRFRASWRRAELARGGVWAVGACVASFVVLIAIDIAWPLAGTTRQLLRLLPFAALAGFLGALLWRTARVPDPRRLALRAEEELPELEHYLITALDAPSEGDVASEFRKRAEERLRMLAPSARVPLGLRPGAAAAGGAALLLSLLILAGGPAEVLDRWLRPADAAAAVPATGTRGGAAALPAELEGALRVEELRWTVVPPAYSGLPAVELGDAATIGALPGSRIRVRASAPPGGVRFAAQVVGGQPLTARLDHGDWSAGWTLAPAERGVVIELVRSAEVLARRVVPIIAGEDRSPAVRLHDPAEDLVIATAEGMTTLRATARDDFGVAAFHLTWIHTSGSGESFSFRQGEWSWDRVVERDGALHGEYALDLAATGLQPGDVLHVRAVARDHNDVTGPGEGVSNTRVIRVIRAGEEAQITTQIGFPLEAEDDPVLSQRMIILMTEQLRDRRPVLARPMLLHESTDIAHEQRRLRSAVGEEVFVRLSGEPEPGIDPDPGFRLQDLPGEIAGAEAGHGHDHGHEQDQRAGAAEAEMTEAERLAALLEAASLATGTGNPEDEMHFHDQSPIMSMNATKLAAFNAMWAAERELRQGDLEQALVHEYRALEYMQQLREEDRVFARGRQTVRPIDIGAARGTGELDGVQPASRAAAPPAAGSVAIIAELEALLSGLRARTPQDASIALAGVALRLLSEPDTDPAAAALLSEAATAAGDGDVERAITLAARARSALVPSGEAGTALPLRGATSPAGAAYFERLRGLQ